jgi:hypothetical protein
MMQTPVSDLRQLVELLTQYRYVLGSEFEFQAGLARVLGEIGIYYLPEYDLGRDYGRIDFYLPAFEAGLELKVKGSPSAVARQLYRYAACPEIAALVLVSGRSQLSRLPSCINGKPLLTAQLWWGQI